MRASEFERPLAYYRRQIASFMHQSSSGKGIVMKTPNARFLGFAAISVAACIASMPAKASLVDEGITYSLTETVVNSTTDQFTLDITGINGTSDTKGGRYGVQSLAFTLPTGYVSATLPGFTTFAGGLNSSGCNGKGNFFCFNNNMTPTTVLPANSTVDYVFNVTAAAGSFPYTPDFKIYWVGTKTGTYDLVSLPLAPTAVPLPAAAWLLLSGIAGIGAMARRRRLPTAA